MDLLTHPTVNLQETQTSGLTKPIGGLQRYVVSEPLHTDFLGDGYSVLGFTARHSNIPRAKMHCLLWFFSEPVFHASWLCCLRRHSDHRSYCGVSEGTGAASRRALGCSAKAITVTEDVAQLGECFPAMQEVLVTFWLHGEFEASLAL